jgi:hypothetical protein
MTTTMRRSKSESDIAGANTHAHTDDSPASSSCYSGGLTGGGLKRSTSFQEGLSDMAMGSVTGTANSSSPAGLEKNKRSVAWRLVRKVKKLIKPDKTVVSRRYEFGSYRMICSDCNNIDMY